MKRLPIFATLLLLTAAFGWFVVAAEPQRPSAGPATAVVIDASKYPSLQAALDAVPESGGLVKLPPGDFRLSEPLVLSRKNTRIEGAGAATRLINCNREGKPALILRPADLGKNPSAMLWRVQLADFRISGDAVSADPKSDNFKNNDGGCEPPADGKPKSGDGIFAQNVDELYVSGLAVDHNGRHGIHLDNCYEDPRISDSIITYNAQTGLYIHAGHDIVVNANQFEENQDAVRCIDSFNLCMNGNNLDDHLGNGVVIEDTYGSVLSGNMIEECNGTAIILDRDCYGITISANVIAHNVAGGVDLRDAWGCSVSANTFTLMAARALVVGPASGRITITGNNFSNCWIGGKHRRPGHDAATGIILEGTSDIAISGNVFSGLENQAVVADAKCQRIAVVGNVATDVNHKAQQATPAFDLAGAKDSILEHNIAGPPAAAANR